MIRIGHIYANIGGDYRYGQDIDVHLLTTEAPFKVQIQLSETDPIGGMDGPGGAHRPKIKGTWIVEANDAKTLARELVKGIKACVADYADTIKQYGKPTKRFEWYPTTKDGLSTALCLEALERVLVRGKGL